MTDESDRKEPSQDRRGFFRDALFQIMRPAANYLDKKLSAVIPIEPARTAPLLRPPGAKAEREFLSTCLRCGNCADQCPADAIQLLAGDSPLAARAELKGTPYILPEERACVICTELACMKACPSGALSLVDRAAIRIGMAVVDHAMCVRSRGEPCMTCVEVCPIGADAIRVGGDGRIEVIDPSCNGVGCTGCGLCQERCPTRPTRAIRVHAYPERRQ